MKFRIYGVAHISKYLGEVEADSAEEAETKAWDELHEEMHMSVCHQCTNTIGGDSPEVSELTVEAAE